MTLDSGERRLVRLSTAIVLGNWEVVREVREQAEGGEPNRAWREAVLQVHLFAGVPRQVEAYEVLDRAGGLGALEAGEALDAPADPREGTELFETIYGRNAEAVRARLRGFQPDFATWVLGHAYGRVLSRPGLSADRRELLAVAALAATGQDRQLASHARGAIACGASAEKVRATLDAIEDLVDPGHLDRARAVVARFARS